MPGFTQAQYQKLALLYAMASARAGTWLIPAFHAAIDEGLSDAHDDPQNFDMDMFVSAMTTLRMSLGGRTDATPRVMPASAPTPAPTVALSTRRNPALNRQSAGAPLV